MPADPTSNGDVKAPREGVRRSTSSTRRITWGIFEVAYDDPPVNGPPYYYCMKGLLMPHRVNALSRLLRDLWIIAPGPFLVHVAGSLWMSAAPAITLYLYFSILQFVQVSATSRIVSPNSLMLLASAWLGCGAVSTLVGRCLDENRLVLGAHLRAHFLPKLAKACLDSETDNWDGGAAYASSSGSLGFGEGTPALDLIVEVVSRARDILTVALEFVVLALMASNVPNPDAFILKLIYMLTVVVTFLAPSNGVGGSGYTFWTKNIHYHRLCGLHSTVFDLKYREAIMKDGAGKRLHSEYETTLDSLGPAKSDALALACYIPLPWYWAMARTIVIEYPAALYCLILPWSLSPRSLGTIALIQHAATTLGRSVDLLRRSHDPCPVIDQIRRFYQVLDRSARNDDPEATKCPLQSGSPRGMKVSLRNVSSTYQGPAGEVLAVEDVSLDIEPGQLVVIVGGNGSGKTSLLRLLGGLDTAKRGDVLIDDRPIREYDMGDLRRSMAFLTQSEEIYPASLRENFLLAVPDMVQDPGDIDDAIDEAARLGEAYELIQKLGYDAILNPPGMVGQSMKGCGNGDIGPGALEELQRNSPNIQETTLSRSEKQRLAVSRTFMRSKKGDIRLLLVDEPTSALDPIAERDILQNFCDLKNGKTMICVTHRLGDIVRRADVILCMKGGKIVQKGTHGDLMLDEQGEYRRFYEAQ
ncbi:putative P-loop containing nucleoside triphosphate hydrolase protein [Lyophyllum shimeji]|uniref:P-loop containing nucleoside triphosphate hydrolase protein n=1 Tax=Lyophyllum shimeji TaxID=47721 RepID=A0A9P3UKG7_LYOSH|nr:putative P-loop containing nucleoside triphosphate hydrolase protein [Lyophyllum shimeji]